LIPVHDIQNLQCQSSASFFFLERAIGTVIIKQKESFTNY